MAVLWRGVAVGLLTIVIYAMALAGGFVETWGRDYTFTLKHYVKAFGIEWGPHGLIWAGCRLELLLDDGEAVRDRCPADRGARHPDRLSADPAEVRRTVLRSSSAPCCSFAIPGTVIGVSYILAFNVPPIEITGTALILVVCNVFRNMPSACAPGWPRSPRSTGVWTKPRTHWAPRGATTLRRVLLPLLKPAVIAALVYSFVRAMTTVSAVIFLVSAEYEWATTYIINRVVNGDYGVAIAYSSVLIVLMLAVIWLIQRVIGERRLGRREAAATVPAAGIAQLGGTAA
jgi:iron(III) transport system permease protein